MSPAGATAAGLHRVARLLSVAGAWLAALALGSWGPCRAEPVELGRLFYTPAQRAQLEHARNRKAAQPPRRDDGTAAVPPAPVRFDGVVIRSDGRNTRWVDGKAEVGAAAVPGLKPGQVRAGSTVYEPYQVLRPVSPQADDPGVGVAAP